MNQAAYRLEQTKLTDSKVFRDAVHNYIHVDQPLILDLINSHETQRLRRIKQLGGTHQVYQSAEHSRFCHSLGVYFIARKMIFNSAIGAYLNDYDKLTVMCAALLHDIGHGPFSHCFEDAFDLNHEAYTIKIINGKTEVHDLLEKFDHGFSHRVSSVIEKTHPNKILVQMVSSQLDADRMDYLLRDSYFSGTTYGQFDLSRILRVMAVCDGKIVFKNSGVQAIENYILARYHMYWQVYYHPTARSYEQVLISIFRRMKDLYAAGYDFGDIRYLKPFLDGHVDENDYTKLDEGIVFYYFTVLKEGNDEILKDLCTRFLDRRLFIYHDLLDQHEKQLAESFYEKKGYDPRYYVVSDDQSQVPYRYYGNTEELSEIEILIDEELRFLPEVSEIVGAIVNSKKNKNDHKIFYPEV